MFFPFTVKICPLGYKEQRKKCLAECQCWILSILQTKELRLQRNNICLFFYYPFLLAINRAFYCFYTDTKFFWLVRHSRHRPCCPPLAALHIPAWRHLAGYTLTDPWAAMAVDAFPVLFSWKAGFSLLTNQNPFLQESFLSFPEWLGFSKVWPPTGIHIIPLPFLFHKHSLIIHQALVHIGPGYAIISQSPDHKEIPLCSQDEDTNETVLYILLVNKI